MPKLPPPDPYVPGSTADIHQRGPLPGWNVETATAQDRVNRDLESESYLFWVEGQVIVGYDPWDHAPDGPRETADRIAELAERLGLHAHRRYLGRTRPSDVPDPNDIARRRDHSSLRRTSSEDIRLLVEHNPGITRTALRDALYAPTDAVTREVADQRLKMSIHRLRRRGYHLQVRYDAEGRQRLFGPEVPTNLPAGPGRRLMTTLPPRLTTAPVTTASGDPPPPTDPPPPPELPFEILSAAADALRRLLYASVPDADAVFWRDVAREVIGAAVERGLDPLANLPVFPVAEAPAITAEVDRDHERRLRRQD